MQFITGKDEPATEEQSELDKLKASVKGNVKCRICKMDHWTKECPYKDDLGAIKVKETVSSIFYEILGDLGIRLN